MKLQNMKLKKKFFDIFKTNMSNNKVIELNPSEKLEKIKDERNFTIAHIAKISGVKRDVISRFLEEKNINHIDFIKIRNSFPDIDIRPDQRILPITKLNMFGTIQKNGSVSQLMLNDSKTVLIPTNIKKLFSKELIGLHVISSSSKYILQIRKDHNVFNENEINNEFLVKTLTNSYYGVMRPCNNHICLASVWDFKKLNIHKEDSDSGRIVEIYDLVMKISNKWSVLKDNKLIAKERELKGYDLIGDYET